MLTIVSSILGHPGSTFERQKSEISVSSLVVSPVSVNITDMTPSYPLITWRPASQSAVLASFQP